MVERYTSDGEVVRPSIQGRDSSGQNISLLNEEPPGKDATRGRYDSHEARRMNDRTVSSRPQVSTARFTTSPATPDLLRSNSYDSNNTTDPVSPITPISQDFARPMRYPGPCHEKDHHQPAQYYRVDPYQYNNMGPECSPEDFPGYVQRSYLERGRHPYPENNYDDDAQRPEKDGVRRYACRYKEEFNCSKTFTTSGHASRHAKIHTSEKSIDCTHPGCHKKFTRQDNMKQHLETHTKERSRSSLKPTSSGSKSVLTQPASVRKPASSGGTRPEGRLSRPPSRGASIILSPSSRGARLEALPLPLDPALLQSPTNIHDFSQQGPAATSPALSSYGAFAEMRGIEHSLPAHSQQPGQVDHRGLESLVAAAEITSEAQTSPRESASLFRHTSFRGE